MSDHRDELAAIPAKWEKPPPSMIEQIPKGNTRLDYMGHAAVTRALIEVDPEWNWGLGWADGEGHIDAFAMTNPAQPTVMLGTLTVLGVTRQCVGTVDRWKGPDTFKELIGDLLRNGAMRFGIGTALWSKSQWEALPESSDGGEGTATPRAGAPSDTTVSKPTWEQVKQRIQVELSEHEAELLKAWAHEKGWKVTARSLTEAQALEVLAWQPAEIPGQQTIDGGEVA